MGLTERARPIGEPTSGPPRASWGFGRASARARRRTAATARVDRPIAPGAVHDPLARSRPGAPTRAGRGALMMALASVAHVVVLGSFFVASAVLGGARSPDPRNAPIEVMMRVEEPPPPPEPPPPEPEATKPPEPEAPPKPKPAPKKTAPQPPPDPIDVPKEPPKPPPKPARRIVGLSLESTVEGAGGPTFATGNTRMGETERRAEDPSEAKALPKAPSAPETSNRKASRLPIGLGGATLVKPKYAGPRLEPKYPEDYRAQNLEAKITLEVVIGPDGRVEDARVVAGSPYAKFEEAALAAARKQRWVPAQRGEEAVSYTLTYSYTFTLKD